MDLNTKINIENKNVTLSNVQSCLADQINMQWICPMRCVPIKQSPCLSESPLRSGDCTVHCTCCQLRARRALTISKMFRGEPEGPYRCTKSTAIAPFWFSTEHHWTSLTPLWHSTDDALHHIVLQSKEEPQTSDEFLSVIFEGKTPGTLYTADLYAITDVETLVSTAQVRTGKL